MKIHESMTVAELAAKLGADPEFLKKELEDSGAVVTPNMTGRGRTEAIITRMLWEDFDGFFNALKTIAEENMSRDVISTNLFCFWEKIEQAVYGCNLISSLPKDD